MRCAGPGGPVFGPVHSADGDLCSEALCCVALCMKALLGVAGSVGFHLGAHLCFLFGGR